MKYRIELAATAKADIRGQAQWLREYISPAAATKWLHGLYKAIDTLQTRPLKCPVAAESDKFPAAIHELLYGRRGKRNTSIGSSSPSARTPSTSSMSVTPPVTNWSPRMLDQRPPHA